MADRHEFESYSPSDARSRGRKYNVYCDESCHLENDKKSVMVLGAIWGLRGRTRKVAETIRSIKKRHHLPADFEIKWTKVSESKVDFYDELLRYFFWEKTIFFRALIAKKDQLQHDGFGQSHDDWYYKMYFNMLKVLIGPRHSYNIYLDIKDTQGGPKVQKLQEVLCNSIYDFSQNQIERIQQVDSHEVEQIQLADLLIGCVGYANRGLSKNAGKVHLVELMRQYCGRSLTEKNSPLRERKVNLFHWQGRGCE